MSFFFHSLACPRIFDLTCPHWGPASTLCRRNMERHEPVRACVHPPAEDERAATNQGEGGGSGEVRENRVTEIFTGETRSVPSCVQVELTPRDFEFPAEEKGARSTSLASTAIPSSPRCIIIIIIIAVIIIREYIITVYSYVFTAVARILVPRRRKRLCGLYSSRKLSRFSAFLSSVRNSHETEA